MSADAPSPSPRAHKLAYGLCAAGVVLFVLTRLLHPIKGLGNADIGGILYQADILRDGGLPYRDAIDMKSPGPFFLVAAVFVLFGRELWIVKLAYAGWALLAAPAIWLAARALYGRGDRGTIAAGAAVLLYLQTIGMFDFNYSAWMTPAYAWAFALLLLALTGRPRLHVAAGAAAGLAFLFKTHALVLAPAFACVWLWARRRGLPGAGWRAWPAWLLGALMAFAPLVLLYAARGATGHLLAGLFPIEWAVQYAERTDTEEHWLWRAYRIPLQVGRAFPLQTWLGALALVGVWWSRRHAPRDMPAGARPVAPQLLLLAWSVVGCGLGGQRYYIHYLTQYLPALALLAAHPAAWTVPPGPGRPRTLGRAALAVTAALAIWQLSLLPRGRAARVDHRGMAGAATVGEIIREHTRPDECIFVWGWAGWPVYYWADRRSCSPIFKGLGQVTDANQNSLFRRSRATDFRPGPYADMLLEALRERPPAYFVRLRPFFPGVRHDPLDQWKELHDLIEKQYVFRERHGKLYLFERLDRLPPEEREAARRKGETAGAKPKLEIKPVTQEAAPKKRPTPPPVAPRSNEPDDDSEGDGF